MDLRFFTALSVGKVAKTAINRFGGGATAAPGLISQNLDKEILKKLSLQLEKTILISGTNGKTTTSRIVASFLEKNSFPFIHNREGSNLERGIVSSLIEDASFSGSLKERIGLFEVDEAAIAPVITRLTPTTIVFTNLFRDQLDRYGEIDTIKTLWAKAVGNLSDQATLVLNADDPTLAFLGKNYRGKVIYFGIEEPKIKLEQTPTATDSINCPQCRSELDYSVYYLSHQGLYRCKNCDFKRPEPDVIAKTIELSSLKSEFTLDDKEKVSFELETFLPGVYNIYNCLAAYCALKASNFSLDQFPSVVKNFKPAFGRTERLEMQGRKIVVALAKNPTGFNEVIRTFLQKNEESVLIAVNDLIADGRDISWLWDVDFESLAEKQNKYFTTGLRANEMALRLKYAGIKNYSALPNMEQALEEALSSIPQNDTLTIIPTYTAMLQLKKLFVKKGIGAEFWED